MNERYVLVAVRELPRDGRDGAPRRKSVARYLADEAAAMGLVQVDPVKVAYVEEAESVAGAVRVVAAAAGVPLADADLASYVGIDGWRFHVAACPVVEPDAVVATIQPEGITAGLRTLLANGMSATQIAARTRLSVPRIDAIRAEMRLPYQSTALGTAGRELQAVGST